MKKLLLISVLFLLLFTSTFTNSALAKTKSPKTPSCGGETSVLFEGISFGMHGCIEQRYGVIYSSASWAGAPNASYISIFIRDDTLKKTVIESDDLTLPDGYGVGSISGPSYMTIPYHSYHVYARSFGYLGYFEANSPQVIGEYISTSNSRSHLTVKVHGKGNYR